MARQPHDQFAKQFLVDLLEPIGQVGVNHEVHGERRYVDLYFSPSEGVTEADFQLLGLLGQMVSHSCLLEPFRNPLTKNDIRNCMLKLFLMHSDLQRRSVRHDQKSLTEEELPHLWILATSASETLLESCHATLNSPQWCQGIYFLGETLKTAIVVINRLPITPDTLFLRLLGRGATQQQAINELLAFPATHSSRNYVLELLSVYHIGIQTKTDLTDEDKELLMNVSQAYLKWREETLWQGLQQGLQEGLQKGLQEGRQEGRLEERRVFIENLLESRFGVIDEALSQLIEPLLQISPAESSRLLIQLSREELLARFGNKS